MTTPQLCQVWNVSTSVSAIGAFAASSKPPQRTLSCLRNASRDVRLLVADQATGSLTTSVALNAIRPSQPAATSSPAPVNVTSQLSAAIQRGQLDLAVAEYKRLQSRQTPLATDLVEALITGTHSCTHQQWLEYPCVSTGYCTCTAALLKKQKLQAALAVYDTAQQGQAVPTLHYNTYQALLTAAIKVHSACKPDVIYISAPECLLVMVSLYKFITPQSNETCRQHSHIQL